MDKSKIKAYKQKCKSVWAKTYNYIPLLLASIHCQSKIKKQDLEGERS